MREKFRERPGVREEIGKVLRAVTDVVNAREDQLVLKDFITSSREVIFSYAGPYSSPARYSTLFLSSVTQKYVRWMHPQELTYYYAPYSEAEGVSIVIYASEASGTLNMLIDQLSWTGHKLLVVSGSPLPDALKHKLRDEKLIYLKGGEWLLKAHLFIGLSLSLIEEGVKVRLERVLREFRDVGPVIGDLINSYEDVLVEVEEFLKKPAVITGTPTMWGAAECIAHSSCGGVTHYLSSPESAMVTGKSLGRVLIFDTDVEEFSVRPLKMLSLTGGVETMEIRLRTDPLTSPLYGIILARILCSGG